MNRRDFLKLTKYAISTYFFNLLGCGSISPKIYGGFDEITKGYNFFNKQNPNLRLGVGTYGTFYKTILDYGFSHEGIGYKANKFYACASGKVYSSCSRNLSGGHYTDSGDGAVIMHGLDVYVDYYHMQTGSCTLKPGEFVNRGDFIGKAGAPRKMHLKLVVYRSDPRYLSAVNQGRREDPDNYGHKMGYMQYWDGKESLDLSYEEVTKRSKIQDRLINNFVKMYDGPYADEVHKGIRLTINNRIYKLYSNDMFKFGKFLYEKDPTTFKGNKSEISTLIGDIYENQPVVLTLPFK